MEEDIALYRIRENKCPDYISNSIKINCENPHDNIYRLEDTIKTLFIQIEKRFNISIDCSIDVKKDYDEILKTFVNNKKSNSLAICNKELLKEWNYEKNINLDPEYFDLWLLISHRSIIGGNVKKDMNGKQEFLIK